jgi:acyl-ACP thioesterase
MAKQYTPDAEMEKIYQDLDKYGYNSKYWSKIDEVISWLESREEYEKCADLYDYKKFYPDTN